MPPPSSYPIHKLCCPGQPPRINLILAANGPFILSLNLQTGELLSKWPEPSPNLEQAAEEIDQQDFEGEGSAPKKRKLDSKRLEPGVVLPNVSHIISTRNKKHVVAVTAKDKTVRVFDLDSYGVLKLLSARTMPKRPCALVLTRDDKTLLVGDKFGDIYALPLLPDSKDKTQEAQVQTPPKPTKLFQPSASLSTVHTKGNREALRQQQLQEISVKKQAPLFENELILGHVSLLTDLVVAVDPSNSEREFILTADRDEHIRVSRSIPQAHVIHAYCQAHTKFVSKLLIDPSRPGILISAGGEPSLKIFDWLDGKLLTELNLMDELRSILANCPSQIAELRNDNFSVSCLQSLRMNADQDQDLLLLLAFEGIPSILSVKLDMRQHLLNVVGHISLTENVLDIVPLEHGMFLVAMDTFHEAWSMKSENPQSEAPRVVCFKIRRGEDEEQKVQQKISDPQGDSNVPQETGINKADEMVLSVHRALQLEECQHPVDPEKEKPEGLYSPLGEFLYGLENLRKRVNVEDDRDDSDGGTGPKISGGSHEQ